MTDQWRGLPQDAVAERNVLRLALGREVPSGPAGAYFLTMRAIVKADDFFTPAHATVWRALEAIYDAGKPLEFAALEAELRETDQLETLGRDGTADGGAACLAGIVEGYESATGNPDYFANEVADKARRRELIVAGIRLTASAAYPLLVDALGAATLCSVSQAEWLAIDSSGDCPWPIQLGRKTLWVVAELADWCRAGAPSRKDWECIKEERRETWGHD